MKTRLLISASILLIMVLSACAPAATPAPLATAARRETSTQPPRLAEPTKAPEAIQPRPTPAAASTQAVAAPNNGADNYFQDEGVNPREKTFFDNLSTFGLDVDTASYTLTKQYIEQGTLPPYEAVRAEEIINAIDQGYAAPRDAAFTLYADGALSPFARRGVHLLRIGVQGYKVSARERKDAHLTFVIDISGSMAMENRLELVKDSLRELVNRLDELDTVAIVVYGSDARVVLETTPGSETERIMRAIDRLRPEGSTNVQAGLEMGYRLAFEHFYPSANNRVILCSDGVANTGATNPDTLVDMVRGYVDEGISLVTIGFGMGNYNDALMERLADGGDGSYHYVNQFEEARRLFTEDLTATLEVIAYDAKIQVEFNPETVARYRLIGYENRAIADEDFRNDSVDAGEVGAGMSATALYETELLPGAEGWIARANLRWQDADTREVREIAGDIFTRNLATPFYDTDPHFQLTAAAAAFAEVLRASPYVDATYSEIAEYAGRAANGMPENGQARELTDLIWHAARISRSR
jgi:Ca-activated chloride channel family protein